MRKFILFAICSTILIGSAAQALRFGSPPTIKIPDRTLVKFLPSRNEALEKALEVHNLMTELPALQVMADQEKEMKSQLKEVQQFFDKLKKCNEMRLGRFKNSDEVLKKVRKAYQEQAKQVDESEEMDEDSIVPVSISRRNQLLNQKKDIEEKLLTDVFKNGKKWGGEPVGKNNTEVPKDLRTKLIGTGLEELKLAEEGAVNAKMADLDFEQTLNQMQARFVQRLASVGLKFPNFDARRNQDVYQVRQALTELKKQYLAEAEEYIKKLDEQDAAHPDAVARRTARTKNTKNVLQSVQQEYPEVFAHMNQYDQQTPQQQQRVLMMALTKDAEGTVFLTETNAMEIDQKMAEAAANKDMIKNMQNQVQNLADAISASMPDGEDIDLEQCAAG